MGIGHSNACNAYWHMGMCIDLGNVYDQ